VSKENRQDEIMKYLLEAIDFVLVTDADGKIVFINNNHAKILGVTPESLIGKPVQNVIPNTRMHIVAKTGEEEIGSVFKLKNGQNIVCNRIPIRKGKDIIGVVAITAFKEMNELIPLLEQIDRLNIEIHHYQKELRELRGAKYRVDNIVGNSAEIIKLKKIITNVAQTNSTVLISGETGTGKELVAHSIHDLSKRRYKPFIRLSCAAIPENLLESELFGYDEGAFTGAKKGGKAGKFELAHEGSLFLDEINQLPMIMQSKLLRVIQEKELERVGAISSKRIDVRLICASNQSLLELVKEGKFREDLYYRINVVEVNMPPLRDRLEDLELLVNFLVDKINLEQGIFISGVDKKVFDLFRLYTWPGNVREFEHVLERAANSILKGQLKVEHFKFMRIFQAGASENDPNTGEKLEDIRGKAERNAIIKAVVEAGGNKSQASEKLGIDRSVLYDKIRKYKISI
jgi:PAS domain S-box-containing protein